MTRSPLETIGQNRADGGFPAVRSLPAPEALAHEIEVSYDIGPVQRCTLLRSLTNDVYEIAAPDARYVFKVYGHNHRSPGEIAWEVELLSHLTAKRFPVAPAIPRSDDTYVGTLQAPEGTRQTALFAYAEGTKPEGPSQHLYRGLGGLTAWLHQATDDFTTRQPRRALDLTYLLDRSLDVVLPALAEQTENRAFVARLAEAARGRIGHFSSQGLNWGVCHGDVSLDNIHITGDQRIIIYDLDMSGPGWRACDPYGVMLWIARGHPEFWSAFLDGYRERRALTKADMEAMPWFVPIRLLDNMRFHLDDWRRLRGTLALNETYIADELAALRRWDQEALNRAAASI